MRVTPAANRNTYSVAIMVVLAPRVAVFARNPGLGNRNTYSVAAAHGSLCTCTPCVAAARGTLFTRIPCIAAARGTLFRCTPCVAAARGNPCLSSPVSM